MEETVVMEYARQLMEARGQAAIAEAAQRDAVRTRRRQGGGRDLAASRVRAADPARPQNQLTADTAPGPDFVCGAA